MVWTLIYMVIAVVFIWWVLKEAAKLGEVHGGESHGQNQHHDEPEKAPANDDLTVINGIGSVLAPKLNQLGISTYKQLAGLSESDIERIDTELNFKGRIRREKWIEQAQEILQNQGR